MAKLKPGMRFEMIYKKLRATLEVTADAFVVKAGSQFPVAVQEEFAKNHPGSAAIREQLLASGAVVQKSPAALEAACDIPFSAPSTASSVLRGGPGERTHWKGGPENKSLRTIAEHVQEPVGEAPGGIPLATLLAIEDHFHALIRQRAGDLIVKHQLKLPRLARFHLEKVNESGNAWFPVPGMFGGFAYRIEGEGQAAKLVVESWCRAEAGSGQRHEISTSGAKLLEEGFV